MTVLSDEPGALASLGHELKTPLSAIAGYADAMRQRVFGPLDGAYAEAAEAIHAAASHMATLIERLTDIAALEDGHRRLKIERFDVAEVARQSATLLERETKAKGAGVIIEGEPLSIEADALAVKQILINLLANALAAGAKRIRASLSRTGASVAIMVTDDGPGVAGTAEGLGLRLVRTLVAAHGGQFTLENPPNGGALATVLLPAPVD